MSPRVAGLVLPGVMAVVVAICHALLFGLPLVQDDWILMARFRFASFAEAIAEIFRIDGRVFLRPGGLQLVMGDGRVQSVRADQLRAYARREGRLQPLDVGRRPRHQGEPR